MSIPKSGKGLAVALQGGGALGAFSWGVLDALLEAGVIPSAASGASAGAVNAILLAHGLLDGPEAARKTLSSLWSSVGRSSILSGSTIRAAAEVWKFASIGLPFMPRFQPTNDAVLRGLLSSIVDFERIRRERPIHLAISALDTGSGRGRIFTEADVDLNAVLASCSLPGISSPVIVGNRKFRDGGYAANPPLRALAMLDGIKDILLVRLTSDTDEDGDALPFKAGLGREMDALDELLNMTRAGQLADPVLVDRLLSLQLQEVSLHAHSTLTRADPLDSGSSALSALWRGGRAALVGKPWLAGFHTNPQEI